MNFSLQELILFRILLQEHIAKGAHNNKANMKNAKSALAKLKGK